MIKTISVAIQGEIGSFSHEAALRLAREQALHFKVVPCALSSEVFALLIGQQVDASLVPIENSLAGPVVEHYDLLLDQNAVIESEYLLRISHNLIALPGATLEELSRVSSHPVALAQCRKFFRSHPAITAVPHYDTAGSVKELFSRRDPSAGAIAGPQAAVEYGGEILIAGIEDNPANYTRFLLLKRPESIRPNSAADKVSIAFTVENRPGTLVEALQIFAHQRANLTKIESRPVQGKPWEYVFYVDYRVPDLASADQVLHNLSASCSMVKELGRYRSTSVPLNAPPNNSDPYP